MSDVTRILAQIEQGDPNAAEQLLPLVYEELRKLAGGKLAHEHPGQTLQATALVHEAYLRLVNTEQPQRWDNRGHFFTAAAEAMRRILVENARRKGRLKRGGDWTRKNLTEIPEPVPELHEDLVALDAALSRLQKVDPEAVQLVHLRYFAGFSNAEAAELLGISPRTADRLWAYARTWLRKEIGEMEVGDTEK